MEDKTKNNILEAALKLFQRFGYKKTTIEDISMEAQIGKGSVYLHFKSKEDILLTLVQNHQQEMGEEWIKIVHKDWPVHKKIATMFRLTIAEIQKKREEISLTTMPPHLVQSVIRMSERDRACRLALLATLIEPLFQGEGQATKRNKLAGVLMDSLHNIIFRLDIDKTFPWEDFLDNLLESLLNLNPK